MQNDNCLLDTHIFQQEEPYHCSMVALYIGIRGFLPKNPTYKPAKYLFSDSMAATVKRAVFIFTITCRLVLP